MRSYKGLIGLGVAAAFAIGCATHQYRNGHYEKPDIGKCDVKGSVVTCDYGIDLDRISVQEKNGKVVRAWAPDFEFVAIGSKEYKGLIKRCELRQRQKQPCDNMDNKYITSQAALQEISKNIKSNIGVQENFVR